MIIKSELLARIVRAKDNGSKVASAILTDIETKGSEWKAEYDKFSSVRALSSRNTMISIRIRCAAHADSLPEVTESHSPDSCWTTADTIILSAWDFALQFPTVSQQLPSWDEEALAWGSYLALPSKINLRVSDKASDFKRIMDPTVWYDKVHDGCITDCIPAYTSGSLYDISHEDVWDWYHRILGAEVLIAETDKGAVIGAGLYFRRYGVMSWDAGESDHKFECHDDAVLLNWNSGFSAVTHMAAQFMRAQGGSGAPPRDLWLPLNTMEDPKKMVTTNQFPASIRWYNGKLYYASSLYASFIPEVGWSRRTGEEFHICPFCGAVTRGKNLCTCEGLPVVSTEAGLVYTGPRVKTRKYGVLPKSLVKNGELTPTAQASSFVEKLLMYPGNIR